MMFLHNIKGTTIAFFIDLGGKIGYFLFIFDKFLAKKAIKHFKTDQNA